MVSISGSIAAAGAIGGAVIGSSGAQSAANTQAAAADQAAQVQQNIYNTTTQNLAPYNKTGQSALYSLASLYGLNANGTGGNGKGVNTGTPAGSALAQLLGLSGISPTGGASSSAFTNAYQNFTNSPTYQFALQQGSQALDRSAAAQGTLLSGGQLKAAQQYGQGLASQGLNTYTTNLQSLYSGLVGGLTGLSQQGENAAATTGAQGNQAAGTIGNALEAAGTAGASGIAGSTNATTGGLANSLAALTGSSSSYGGTSPLASLLNGSSSSSGGWGTSGASVPDPTDSFGG